MMKKTLGVGSWVWAVLLFTPYSLLPTLHAVEIRPVISAELLMGQYWYNGADSSLGGVAGLSASPYMKFNDRWSVVPLYQGRYQGTKQVSDFTGGGTLFQDSQNHNVSVKGIRSFENGVKLKAITGYGIEWLRETRDEDWTKGLYDNKRLSMGTEAEWSWKENHFVRLGYDHYRIHFPNYQSLESQTDEALRRELAQPNVLDNNNHRFALGAQVGILSRGQLEMEISQTLRSFPDQQIVGASGGLTSTTRQDSILDASLQGIWPVWGGEAGRVMTGLGYSWTRLDSDQNSFYAAQPRPLPNFYDYTKHGISHRWIYASAHEVPWTLQLIGSAYRQSYADRPIQNSVGTYETDTTDVDSAQVAFGFGYPIARGFQLRGQVALGWSDSNNTYAQTYQYHYNTASYLLGFSYAY